MPRVGQIAQAEGDRILARGARHLVDELLGAEMDLRPYWVAEMRGAQRRAMVDELRDRLPAERLVLEAIGLGRRAEDLVRLWWHAERLANQAVGGLRFVGGDVLAREAFRDEFVRHHLAGRIDRGARTVYARRTFRVPGGAIGAHALHPHRLAGGACDERRIHRRIAGIVPTIGARAGDPDRAHLVLGHAQKTGDAVPNEVRLLRAGPDGAIPILDLGDRARRAHAGVRLERPLVFRLHQLDAGRAQCGIDVALRHLVLALDDLRRADVLIELVHRRERRRHRLPVDLQRLCRTHRVPLLRCHHRYEILVAHHARTADALDRGFVDRAHLAGGTRRTQYPGVQHAGPAHIGDELIGAVHLPRHVAPRQRLADYLVLGRRPRLGRHADVHRVSDLLVPFHLVVEVAAADEIGIRHLLFSRRHHAVRDLEFPRGHAELLRRAIDQHPAPLGRRAPQQPRTVGDAGAARGAALVA